MLRVLPRSLAFARPSHLAHGGGVWRTQRALLPALRPVAARGPLASWTPPALPALRRAASSGPNLYKDQNDTWVDRHVPEVARPYLKLARVDRPIGSWLLLWPGWWGIALAAPAGGVPDASMLALFALGTVAMRGAGCTVNDMWDRDVDGQVARTAQRPLASGQLSMKQATVFLAGQLSVAAAVLFQLNVPAIQLGFLALPIVGAYPLMKRITFWPQAFLGLAMNYGVLLGHAATTGVTPWADPAAAAPALLLYGAGVAWTLVYDTLYAHQDKADDARLGLKSTALRLGERLTKPALFGFTAAFAALTSAAGVAADLAWPYYLASLASSAHLAYQVHTADLDDRLNLNDRFVSNRLTGGLLFAGLVGGAWFA